MSTTFGYTGCLPKNHSSADVVCRDLYGKDARPVHEDTIGCDGTATERVRCQGRARPIGDFTQCLVDPCSSKAGACTVLQEACERRGLAFPETHREFYDCRGVGMVGYVAGRCVARSSSHPGV